MESGGGVVLRRPFLHCVAFRADSIVRNDTLGLAVVSSFWHTAPVQFSGPINCGGNSTGI